MKSVDRYNARLKRMNETVKKIKPVSVKEAPVPSKPSSTKAAK